MLTSCDVFPTRTPEDPSSGTSTFEPATNYETVLQNLTTSINDANISNFEKCLSAAANGNSKEFEFIPSASAAALNPGVFSNWTSRTEIRVMKSIFTALQSESHPSFSLSGVNLNNITADSVNLSANYTLTVTFSSDGTPVTYSGSLFFDIYKEDSGYWYINRETDYDKQSDFKSWSYLKINYYN